MNVTLKISDELCKAARHKAVDEGLSLSGYVAKLLDEAVYRPKAKEQSLLDAVRDPESSGKDFEPKLNDFSLPEVVFDR